jgi:RNA polymerase sigma-70 factor (ECF subfamily)
MGGPSPSFPETRWTRIARASDGASPEGRAALDELCRAYWKPIYAWLRSLRDLSNEEAKDLTQEFLVEMIEGSLLARTPRDGAGFRPWLKGALKLFLLERRRADSAQKRGGGRAVVSLDADAVTRIETLSVQEGRPPDEAFDREWARAIIDDAVDALQAELVRNGRELAFRVYDRYELNPPPEPLTYAALAAEVGAKESDVTNWLAHCRRRLRLLVEERIRDTVEGNREAVAELFELFRR